MKKKLIYIASPYTGCEVEGTKRQMIVSSEIMLSGHFPYAPLWLHYAQVLGDIKFNYQDCIEHCLRVLPTCDLLVRLAGESKGADVEEAAARNLGIPVLNTINLMHMLSKDPFCHYIKGDHPSATFNMFRGYVVVHKRHPLFGLNYDEASDLLKPDVELTYSGRINSTKLKESVDNDELWAFGFFSDEYELTSLRKLADLKIKIKKFNK